MSWKHSTIGMFTEDGFWWRILWGYIQYCKTSQVRDFLEGNDIGINRTEWPQRENLLSCVINLQNFATHWFWKNSRPKKNKTWFEKIQVPAKLLVIWNALFCSVNYWVVPKSRWSGRISKVIFFHPLHQSLLSRVIFFTRPHPLTIDQFQMISETGEQPTPTALPDVG